MMIIGSGGPVMVEGKMMEEGVILKVLMDRLMESTLKVMVLMTSYTTGTQPQ
jgi:hypothetical protein